MSLNSCARVRAPSHLPGHCREHSLKGAGALGGAGLLPPTRSRSRELRLAQEPAFLKQPQKGLRWEAGCFAHTSLGQSWLKRVWLVRGSIGSSKRVSSLRSYRSPLSKQPRYRKKLGMRRVKTGHRTETKAQRWETSCREGGGAELPESHVPATQVPSQ